ncbi:hypothetical protein [Chlamydia caviae]|uniref:Uncharacterized protein n=1 Tax=Chlamydia caviae (strain ATCC VR-813 / DSM 19441 / 03DC25 / GPIC) TaxID=227941 RepID=Q823R8_CHLCV|nr:hypothetical protein [Chlamydia caviae]AAP05086.1 hypothetical protein CCA_00338 [Chlamydia caviae GPIC]
MLFASLTIHAHEHTNANCSSQNVETATTQVSKLLNPNSKASILRRIAVYTPIIGLFVLSLACYQRRAMSKLGYTPSSLCHHPICASLDPKHLNATIRASLLGGLGLLLPFMILLYSALAIIFLVDKLLDFSCCCSSSD